MIINGIECVEVTPHMNLNKLKSSFGTETRRRYLEYIRGYRKMEDLDSKIYPYGGGKESSIHILPRSELSLECREEIFEKFRAAGKI